MLQRVAIGLVFIFIAGCGSQSQTNVTNENDVSQDIFGTRPIAARPEVLTVRLSNPALLEVGKKTASGWEIPDAAKLAIAAEQAKFLTELKALDPGSRLLFSYRLVLNAVSVATSTGGAEKIKGLAGVKAIEVNRAFTRPAALPAGNANQAEGPTSVDFIGAKDAHARGIDGRGTRIGIIDTGIDYTHSMLGGRGEPEDFKSVKPDQSSPFYPNDKVVGGIDLAGTTYNAASELPIEYIPRPDANPLDEQGHGTHVAGTVAGHGDGKNTYSGVAPAAKLYAIKVFGKDGSTSDAVVIAGLEYAADPSGTMNPNNQLDAVNLSLGSDFGAPHVLYSEAIRNLSRAGTVVVAAAGNSGDKEFIVGSPGTVSEAISVAASVDDSFVNWKFTAVQFQSAADSFLAKAVEGSISKPVQQAEGVVGNLVEIGLGDEPLSDEVKAALRGQVALMHRGKIPFAQKLQFAFDNGAIGAIVVNNAPGEPIMMGGDGHVDIPAIMITDVQGARIKTAMASGPMSVTFKTSVRIEEPQNIDTIASFSSRGPRSEDNLIKPEIAAPGQGVLSAAMGQGTAGVRFNGTSMATPHVAGVVALLKQAHPSLDSESFKQLMMNTAKELKDKDGAPYTIAREGAGRVRIADALKIDAIATSSISLGFIQGSGTRTLTKAVRVKNLSDKAQLFQVSYQGSGHIAVNGPREVTVAAGGEQEFNVKFRLQGVDDTRSLQELNARVILESSTSHLEIPAMAMRVQTSDIYQAQLAGGKLTLENAGSIKGDALVFNLFGTRGEKQAELADAWKSKSCAIKSAGYRFIKREEATVLQFGFQLHQSLSHWRGCELNVQFDINGDQVADIELAGISDGAVGGISAPVEYFSLLLNAGAARQIRSDFEKKIRQGLNVPTPNYTPAVLNAAPMTAYGSSTIAVMEMDATKLSDAGLSAGIKIATLHADAANAVEPDSFLFQEWKNFSFDPARTVMGMPEVSALDARSRLEVNLEQTGLQPLVIYYPNNRTGKDADFL